jgi:hypothetical protein
MSRGRLRAGVVALGVLLLAAALAGATCSPYAELRLALAGLVLVGAVAFERWRTNECERTRRVGTGSRLTSALSIPRAASASWSLYDPANGERRYVAL